MLKLSECQLSGGVGDRAFVYDRNLITVPAFDMPVDTVIANVDHAAVEPMRDTTGVLIKHMAPLPRPG